MKFIFQHPKPRLLNTHFLWATLKIGDESLWYSPKLKKWFLPNENPEYCDGGYSSTADHVINFRAFKRHIKKHQMYLGNNFEFRLCNRYIGYEIFFRSGNG